MKCVILFEKYMKSAALFTTVILGLIFAAGPVSGQTVNPAKLKFKGLGLDSTYAQVVKVLGKPELEDPPKKEECIGGHEKYVSYDGITFYMMDGDSKDKKTFEVKGFEVSTSGILVSGIKVGDTPATVKKVFGRKYTVDTTRVPGETMWYYEMNDRDGPGTTTVVFKNGKVIKIASDYQVC